jgi:hypothetical protein
MDNINLEIRNMCLKYYIFYQKHYKLPEVSKSHLSLIYDLFTNNLYKEGSLIDELENHAFHHSIEVDFQKTGETSNFYTKRRAPTFLTKTAQYKLSNNLIKLKEIYDEYKNIIKDKDKITEKNDSSNNILTNAINANFDDYNSTMSDISSIRDSNNGHASSENKLSFYEFFIERGKFQENKINRKNIKLYDKQKIISDKKILSFIYQLYELISFYPAMQDSFINSIYLMTEDFFYDNNLKEKTFFFNYSLIYNKNVFEEIIKELIEVNTRYENDIKYIMKDNSISIEMELIYFNEYIEPKKEVYKHDVDDYRKNIFELVNFAQKKGINDIEIIRNKYSLIYEDIKNLLFIILFWVGKEDINIIYKENKMKNKINLNHILKDGKKRIKSIKNFINDIVERKTLLEMNNFFYDNIKCFSLYYCYNNFYEEKSNNNN